MKGCVCMFKEKAVNFMKKHPNLTGFAVTTAGSLALAIPMASPLVASADDNVTQTTAQLICTSASNSFNAAVTEVTPVMCTVIGFNVLVRLVRRFVKG